MDAERGEGGNERTREKERPRKAARSTSGWEIKSVSQRK